jgi:hypothetical protein
VRLGEGSEQALDVAGSVPVDVGGFEDLEALLVAIVAAVVIAVVVVPLLLFGVELIIAGLLIAGGILARSALGRPWIVQATPTATPIGALAWEIRGWRRSAQLIDKIATELASGLTPSPSATSHSSVLDVSHPFLN